MKVQKRRKMSQFPFPTTFCLQKKRLRKKQNMCAAMFVCFVGQWVATLGIIIWADRTWNTNRFCRKNSGGGRELYSERLGKDF